MSPFEILEVCWNLEFVIWNLKRFTPVKRAPLGPPYPSLMVIAKETWGFRRPGISPGLRLLIPTFSLPSAPPLVALRLHSARNAPLPPALRAGSSKYQIPNNESL
jgi:hypothetical protein